MDQISDLLTRIKNGYMARKATILAPYSRAKEDVAKVLEKSSYVEKVSIVSSQKSFKELEITLRYEDSKPALTNVERVSKPGLRIYSKKSRLPKVLSGLGIAVVTTSKGVMTDKEARKKGIGGELIARVW